MQLGGNSLSLYIYIPNAPEFDPQYHIKKREKIQIKTRQINFSLTRVI